MPGHWTLTRRVPRAVAGVVGEPDQGVEWRLVHCVVVGFRTVFVFAYWRNIMLRFIVAAAVTFTGILATTPASAFHHHGRCGGYGGCGYGGGCGGCGYGGGWGRGGYGYGGGAYG